MVQDSVSTARETLAEMKSEMKGFPKPHCDECCCPDFVFFIFKEVNCVQIFNGACQDWRPGSPCAKSV